MPAARTSFFGHPRSALLAQFAAWEIAPVHAARLWNQVYLAGRLEPAAMTGLPARVLERVGSAFDFALPTIALETHSSDGFTRKYLLDLADARRIETVLMRYRGRVTACVSSQAGCAMGCVFCATGQMGFARHLSAAEIIAQAMLVDRVLRDTAAPAEETHAADAAPGVGRAAPALAVPAHPSPHHRHERLRNLVLMGMGEPLHNYDAVMTAIDILRDGTGLALAGSRITLSTVGVVPGIVRLADEGRAMHLAVSLHGATQEERAALVPAARAWPLDTLMEACRYYCTKLGRRIFFEWTLIEGKNDSVGTAHAVGRLLQGLRAQVNLIPLNPTAGYAGAPSRSEAAHRFQATLAEYGLPSTVRQRRGIDIAAGCGQLATARRGAGPGLDAS